MPLNPKVENAKCPQCGSTTLGVVILEDKPKIHGKEDMTQERIDKIRDNLPNQHGDDPVVTCTRCWFGGRVSECDNIEPETGGEQ